MSSSQYAEFNAAKPYFELVRAALGDRVEGAHFFDIVAADVIYEVRYEFPGWPRLIHGRADLMARFRGYVEHISLQSTGNLVCHSADDGRTVIIEYEVQGTIRATGASYDNRFASIITVDNRKIVYWRDYMDSLAAWHAMTAGR
jgi:uncharacterized protein